MQATERRELGHIILSHGLESGPNATKISRLAAIAETLGWRTRRPDYSDLPDPQARLQRLQELAQATPTERLLLVGSSIGAYISARVSLQVPVKGLFLLAPPIIMPDQPTLDLRAPQVQLVHGWKDELIPAEELLGYASLQAWPTLMLDDDHRLGASIDAISVCFRHFLSVAAKL